MFKKKKQQHPPSPSDTSRVAASISAKEDYKKLIKIPVNKRNQVPKKYYYVLHSHSCFTFKELQKGTHYQTLRFTVSCFSVSTGSQATLSA